MRGREGFTILELVIVLAIGGILATVVTATFSGVMDRIAVRSAQTEFLTLHAQTRALAIERGVSVRLAVDPTTGIVTIEQGCDGLGTVFQSRDFEGNHAVTLETSGGTLGLCMTPRGYADPAQNTFDGETRIAFVRGDRLLSVVLFPLGQAVRE
jgi:prepilin-type N-terminal cleavage/methylation domain-containing protein